MKKIIEFRGADIHAVKRGLNECRKTREFLTDVRGGVCHLVRDVVAAAGAEGAGSM